MNEKYLDKIILGDCMDYFSNLADNQKGFYYRFIFIGYSLWHLFR